MYLVTNGRIVTEEALLEGFDLLIKEGKIEQIAIKGHIQIDDHTKIVDAAGGYVAPGFIDIHSDYIEHMAAPRPTSLMDFNMSLRETEKELISHGITTIYHSLSLFKTSDYKYRPIRETENAKKFMDLIDRTHHSKHLVRHRFHARFEIDNINEIETLKTFMAENKVHLISFMDHTPGQGQYHDLEVYRKAIKGYKNLSEDEIESFIERRQKREKITTDAIKDIAQLAKLQNIAIASHDDDCLEKLELVQSFGTVISEFPITLHVAQMAKEKGMYTIAGAPNVLLGGSHSGNLSAIEAITLKYIDILCSDYYPSALLHAVFQLSERYQLDLVEMFKLITINPAKAVNMDQQIGSIAEGKKADLLIIEKIDANFPVITSVFIDGKLIQKTNYRM